MRHTDNPVVGCISRRMLDTTNVTARCYYVCKKTCSKIGESESQQVIHVPVDPQIHTDAKLPARPIPLMGLI